MLAFHLYNVFEPKKSFYKLSAHDNTEVNCLRLVALHA